MSNIFKKFFVIAIIGLVRLACAIPAEASDLQAAQKLLAEGEKFVQQARYGDALKKFEQMNSACGPHDLCQAAALFWIARCHLESGQYDAGADYADRARQKYQALGKQFEQGMVKNLQARISQGKNNYVQALQLYNEAEDLIRRHGDPQHPELFAILANRVRVHIYRNNYEGAGKDIQNAEKILGPKPDARRQGILREHKGLVASETGRYKDALKLYDEALKLYQEGQNRSGQCAVLNKRGRVYESQGDYSSALKDYQESLRIAQDIGSNPDQAFALNNLGMLYRKRGNYEKSLEMYDQALRLRDKNAEPQFYVETLANKALAIYLTEPNTEQAGRIFQECYEIAKKAGVPGTQARALHNLAYVMKDQGKFNESRELSQQAVHKAKEIGQKRFEAQAILRLGNLYELYGGFDDAVLCYDQARDIQKRIGDQFFLSTTLVDMAYVETRLGKTKEAQRRLEEARDIRNKIGVPLTETLAKMSLFFLEKHRYSSSPERSPSDDDYGKALKYLEEAQQKLNPNVLDDAMLTAYVSGRYWLDKDPGKAVPKFREVQSAAESSGRLKYKFIAYVGLARACESLEQLAEAERQYSHAVDLSETLRQALDTQAQRTFLDGEPILGLKYASAYEGLSRVRMLRDNWKGSLEASEATKARAFADKLAQSVDASSFGVDRNVLNNLRQVEREIRINLQRLEECQPPQGDRSAIPKLESERNRLDQKLKEMKEKVKTAYPVFYSSRFPRPMSIKDLGTNPNQTLLVYEVTDSGFMTFLCKGNEIVRASFKPVPRKDLETMVNRYRGPMDDLLDFQDLHRFDLKTGKELTDLLLGDMLDHLEKERTITLILDDCLELLPFEMLVLNEGGRISEGTDIPQTKGVDFLLERNPLVYYQSIAALNLAKAVGKAKKPGGRILVIADVIVPSESAASTPIEGTEGPYGGRDMVETLAGSGGMARASLEPRLLAASTYNKLRDDFLPLPETRLLSDDIQNLFKEQAHIMGKEQATLQNFRNKIAPTIKDFGQIVFATHGYFGDRYRPEIHEPVLLLSSVPPQADNLLRMSEVMNLNLSADTVTLLACQTGLGRHVAGEGTMGMGRAFQYAGASSVLMSMWSIDEKPSVLLVKRFLHEIASGKSKIEALKTARKSVREAGYDHPFFWSAFVLVGEGLQN